jgi:hypothetical protein
MDGTWANSIPLLSLLVAVFSAGIVVTKVNSMRQDIRDLKDDLLKKIKEVEDDGEKRVSEIKKDLIERIHDLKRDHERSSEDQGKRIGDLEANAKAARVHMELTEKHFAIPHEINK